MPPMPTPTLSGRNLITRSVDPFTIIPYCHHDVTVLLGQAHAAIPRAGMTEHVREGLLHDAENRGFQFRPQPAQIGGIDLQAYFNAAAFR